MMNKNSGDTKRKKFSFRSVSLQIIEEAAVKRNKPGRKRKIFRILVFLLFTACFLYQVIKFLTYLLEFPTIVNIEIITPDFYISPAFTICNNQRIKRSKYCQKYPDRCEDPDKTLCETHPDYCSKGNRTKVPKEEFRNANYEKEDVLELAHDLKDISYSWLQYDYEESFRKRLFGLQEFSKCYTIFSRVNSPLIPILLQKEQIFRFQPHFQFVFDPNVLDAFDPNSQNGIYFSIHSPFDAVNPFQKGIFMVPGKIYKLTISMQEEKLLPYPYNTNCMDYNHLWEKHNRSGPRSQDMCKQKCLVWISSYCGNCTPIDLVYPSDLDMCDMNVFFDHVRKCSEYFNIWVEMRNCLTECKAECYYVKYTYEVQDRFVDMSRTNSTIDTDLTKIYVDIDIRDTDVLSFTHRPQYQAVEAFSYIGGFIGIWLGVSLVQIYDFFESSVILLRCLCKKKNSKNSEIHNENCV